MPNARDLHGSTMNHTAMGVALGTTSTITTTSVSNCAIGGKYTATYAVAANAAINSPTVDLGTVLGFVPLAVNPPNNTTANQATVLVIGITAAGTMRGIQGQVVPTALGVTTTAGAFITAPQFPALPDDFAAIAYILVRVAPSATAWIPFTSSWAATGVTSSLVQVANLPDRPQIT